VQMTSLAAEIPAYVQGTNPLSIEAVTRRLAKLLRLPLDLASLREASTEWELGVSAAIEKDEELAEKVRRLEEAYDNDLLRHDDAKPKDILPRGISARANVEWTVAYDPDTTTHHLNPVYKDPDWAKGFDVVVHDECSADVKDQDEINGILAPHRAGLPAVVL